MSKFKLKGLGVALVTPFKKNKEVDYDALRLLIEYQIENGVDYIVVLGTTAETPTLSAEEQMEIRRFVVKQVADRVPLVLGLGGNNTMGLVYRLENEDFSGYSAILSVVPYYNKPTQEGIYQHYKALSKASKLPIILYNVPGRTGSNMHAETCLRIAGEFDNIIGVKEASGNLEQIAQIIERKPSEFDVVSGDDGLTFLLMKMGATGVISVAANSLPAEMKTLVDQCNNQAWDKAEICDNRLHNFFKSLFVDGNPAGIKCALNTQGYIENELRLPLVAATQTTKSIIETVLKDLL